MGGETRCALLARWQIAQASLKATPGTAQTAERIHRAGQPRMDDGRRLRKAVRQLVMVRDDQFQPRLARGHGLCDAGDPAIDGDRPSTCPAPPDLRERLVVQAVAFVQAVGHVIADVGTQQLQAVVEQPGGRHAVDVVVAVDHDPPPAAIGRMDALGRLANTRQQVGFAQAGQLHLEERPHVLGIRDAAAQQQLRQDRRDAGARFERRDAVRIVLQETPTFAHVIPVRPPPGNCLTRYFFFSTWTVCLRSRGQYFLSFSFSPPGLRRSV